MKAVAPIMSRVDQNGLGYAAISEDGIFGERWLKPERAFKYRQLFTDTDGVIKDQFQGTLKGEAEYNLFMEKKGAAKKPMMAFIMHARMATVGGVELKNVHPFYRQGVALTHNGSISNHHELTKLYSDCDSETILNEYFDNDVDTQPTRISDVCDNIRGGYACGVLTRDENDVPVLDIFRSTGPSLYVCNVKALGKQALIFCTAEYIMHEVCRELKWDHGTIFQVSSEDMIRLDARTGRFLAKYKFLSRWGQTNGKSTKSNGGNNSGTGSGTAASGDDNTNPIDTTGCAVGATSTQEQMEIERSRKIVGLPSSEKKTTQFVSPKELELTRLATLRGLNLNQELGSNFEHVDLDSKRVVH